MTDILASIYELFSLYSKDLGEHLRGLNIRCKAYDAGAFYNTIGIATVILTLIFAFAYYKFDRIRFAKRKWWALFGFIPSFLVFLGAYLPVKNDINSKLYCKELHITGGDVFGWAFTVFIYSFLLYVGFSFLFKNISTNCRHIPF